MTTDPATHARSAPERDVHLAQCARRALTEARTATLLVEGLGRIPPHPDHALLNDVLLHDMDGRPRFTCTADSAIAAAAVARCPAILDVGAPVSSTVAAGSVIFAGHLAIGPPPAGDSSGDTFIVELHLVSVIVEIDDPQSRSIVARQVPLDVYAGHGAPTPDVTALADAAKTMRLHTNARHAARLRACAAARAGIPDGDIIEARLVEVGARGAVLEWLDAEGGHVVRLGFPREAVDGPELAALLRAQLCAHRGSPR